MVLIGIALVSVVGVVAYLGVNSHQAVFLPAPTGPYRVGRVIEDWVDRTRRDSLAPVPRPRELSVWIWYPAPHALSGPTAAYLPPAWNRVLRLGPLRSWLRTSPALIHPHAIDKAPVAGSHLPVLVFAPGLGLAAYDYTTLAEDLASHGYVVAGINPSYSTTVVLSGDRVIRSTSRGTADDGNDRADVRRLDALWVADMVFVAHRLQALDQEHAGRFAGRLLTERIGFFGHSLGGAAAAEACRVDAQCGGAVDIDGALWRVVRRGIGKPFVFLGHQGILQDSSVRAELRGVLQTVPRGQGHVLTVQGTAHQNFTDRAVYFWALMRPVGMLGAIDGRRGLAITSRYVRAFFDGLLQGARSPLLAGPSSAYPEVRFQSP
jgi:predicted dienelactone hydrolase